jgi:hypothetical protein
MSYSLFVYDDDDEVDDHDDLDKLLMKRILVFFLPGNLNVSL